MKSFIDGIYVQLMYAEVSQIVAPGNCTEILRDCLVTAFNSALPLADFLWGVTTCKRCNIKELI